MTGRAESVSPKRARALPYGFACPVLIEEPLACPGNHRDSKRTGAHVGEGPWGPPPGPTGAGARVIGRYGEWRAGLAGGRPWLRVGIGTEGS